MNQFTKSVIIISVCFFILNCHSAFSQNCTTPGQTPSTAFPVCATTTFQQNSVPICATNAIFVPGCSSDPSSSYQNKNPFFYKFTCYTSSTLGFLITPNAVNEDYDWQLYDITGRNPDEIFTNPSLVVTGNWSGTYGPTGASSSGINSIQCGSIPTDNRPTFAAMPNLIAGHVYLLMVSHYTDTQSGYSLSFGGGTANITDPTTPQMQNAFAECDGSTIKLKLSKNIRCNSLSASGSEFSLSSGAITVMSAFTTTCTSGFDFDEITINLSGKLPSGTYQLVINNGTDGNTLLDICGNDIPAGEKISFDYFSPQPILADSIGKITCAPDSILVYYPKKIQCSTISPGGTDFLITGPTAVTISAAYGNCVNDLSDYIVIKLATPLYKKGTYSLSIQPGIDGSPVFDACGLPILPQVLTFNTADTVSAAFQYNNALGCRKNILTFTHEGRNDVNKWNWQFNSITANTQSHTISFPAFSMNQVGLFVSNGVCVDSAFITIVLDNEVRASFTFQDLICPEDEFIVTNTSSGQIDSWQWKFDNLYSSSLKDPLSVRFPITIREMKYTISLIASNNSLGCSDTVTKILQVMNNCYIAVPTAFTPNNDGLNDFLSPHNAVKADNLDFKVFNRWGQLVFHSRDWREKWNGKINGINQPAGVYVWMLSYTHRDTGKQVFQKGTATLIR